MLSLFEYETTEDAASDGAVATEEPTAEAQEAPDLSGGFDETVFQSDAFRDAVAAEAQALVEARLAQAQHQPPIAGATPGPMSDQLPEYDPYDPDAAQAYFEARDQRMLAAIDERIGKIAQPLEQQQQAQLQQQGEEYIQDILGAEVGSGEDLTDEGKGALRSLFDVFMQSNAQRYGVTPRSAEQSARQAVEYIRNIEKAAATRAATQQANHVATLAGAPAEPGQAGAASAVPGTPAEYKSADATRSELLRKFAA